MVITLNDLARLYDSARQSNSAYAAARKARAPRETLKQLRSASQAANQAYDAARRRHKREQKAARQSEMRTTMIRFYLDSQQP